MCPRVLVAPYSYKLNNNNELKKLLFILLIVNCQQSFFQNRHLNQQSNQLNNYSVTYANLPFYEMNYDFVTCRKKVYPHAAKSIARLIYFPFYGFTMLYTTGGFTGKASPAFPLQLQYKKLSTVQ